MKIESIGSIGSIGSNSKYDSLEFGYQLNTNNVKAKSTVYKKDTGQSRVTALQTFIYYCQHTNEWHNIRWWYRIWMKEREHNCLN